MSLIQTLKDEGFTVKPHPNTNRTGVVVAVQLGTIEVLKSKKGWFILVDVRGECYSHNLSTTDEVVAFLCKRFPRTPAATKLTVENIWPL